MKTHSRTLCLLAALCGTVTLLIGGCGSPIDPADEQQFKQELGNTTITVFPAAVRREQITYDAAAAQQIAEFLTTQRLGDALVSDAEVPLTGPWHRDQSKMWRESAQALAAYVKDHPITTRYAMLPEYLILGGSNAVGGVHLYVVRDDGKIVAGVLLNSHWEAFKAVDPKTVDDCTKVVLYQMQAEFKPGAAAQRSAPSTLGPESSVTVVPVVLAGNPSKDVADVVGLLLEKEGMPNIWTVDTVFTPPADQTLDEVAAAFGQFVQNSPPQTDYALFAEFVGTPQTGVSEVRAVLADTAGRAIWKDRQTPQDADFKRIQPREPMQFCVLLSERLKPVFRLPGPRRSEEGRMARLWAEKSGTPSDAERSAMETRQGKLKASIGTARLMVHPVLVGDAANRPDAEQLANLIGSEFGGSVQTAQASEAFKLAPSSNEQRRLWDLARAFRAYVRDNPPDADYALYAEYTIRLSDQQVWTVHFVVCDRAGEWVIVDFQNNHQPDFQQVDPKTHDDCARLVVRRLHVYLR